MQSVGCAQEIPNNCVQRRKKEILLSEVIGNLTEYRDLDLTFWKSSFRYKINRNHVKGKLNKMRYGLEQVGLDALQKITREAFTIYDNKSKSRKLHLLVGKNWAFLADMSDKNHNPFSVKYALRKEGEKYVSFGVLRRTYSSPVNSYSILDENSFNLSQRNDMDGIFSNMGISCNYSSKSLHHRDLHKAVFLGRILAGKKLD